MKELFTQIGSREYVASVLGVTTTTISNWSKKDSSDIGYAELELLKMMRRNEPMDLSADDKTHERIKKYVNYLGGANKVALALSKTKQAVYKWIWGKSEPDDANYIMLKKFAHDRAKNDTVELEKINRF